LRDLCHIDNFAILTIENGQFKTYSSPSLRMAEPSLFATNAENISQRSLQRFVSPAGYAQGMKTVNQPHMLPKKTKRGTQVSVGMRIFRPTLIMMTPTARGEGAQTPPTAAGLDIQDIQNQRSRKRTNSVPRLGSVQEDHIILDTTQSRKMTHPFQSQSLTRSS
jgi:hypothetical protein